MWQRPTRRKLLHLGFGAAVALLFSPLVHASERTPVESSSIASLGYDAAARVLEIEFKNGGIYRYREVPREVFDAFMAAASKGHYFLERVRGKFDYERVREAKP